MVRVRAEMGKRGHNRSNRGARGGMDPGPARPAVPCAPSRSGWSRPLPRDHGGGEPVRAPSSSGWPGCCFSPPSGARAAPAPCAARSRPSPAPLGLVALPPDVVRPEFRLDPAARPVLRTAAEFLPALAGAFLVARLAPPGSPPRRGRRAGSWRRPAPSWWPTSPPTSRCGGRFGLRVAAFAYNRPLLTAMLVVLPPRRAAAAPGRRGLARSSWRPASSPHGARSAAPPCSASSPA